MQGFAVRAELLGARLTHSPSPSRGRPVPVALWAWPEKLRVDCSGTWAPLPIGFASLTSLGHPYFVPAQPTVSIVQTLFPRVNGREGRHEYGTKLNLAGP